MHPVRDLPVANKRKIYIHTQQEEPTKPVDVFPLLTPGVTGPAVAAVDKKCRGTAARLLIMTATTRRPTARIAMRDAIVPTTKRRGDS